LSIKRNVVNNNHSRVKNFFVTILAFFYLATTTGATLYMHYCMGKFYSVDLVEKVGCNKCGMETTDGCCNDELKVIKVEDNHQPTTNEISFAPAYAIVNNLFNIPDPVVYNVSSQLTTNNNSPPRSPHKSLHILNCVFRI
jgi:hypothetical protein